MRSKREIMSENAALRQEIELLQAKLCEGNHQYVKVGEIARNAGCCVDVEFVYVCTRCGKRKVGTYF